MNVVRHRSPSVRESGLTLVELLVVLFVLALLAATASVATAGLLEQGQQDATLRTLRAIENAVLGAPGRRDPTGQTIVSGFVADNGRLPQVWGTNAATALQELWRRPDTAASGGVDPRTIQPFAIRPASGDPDVLLPTGWRGPYLDLGVRTSAELRLSDGWNRDFELATANGDPLTAAATIAVVRSLGADGLPGPAASAGYELDQEVVFARSVPAPVVPARHTGDVTVVVHSKSGSPHAVVVRLYSSSVGEVVTFFQGAATLTDGNDATFSIPGVPIGPRVVRAYVHDNVAVPQPPADPFLAGTTKSRIYPITVEAGGIQPIVLELP